MWKGSQSFAYMQKKNPNLLTLKHDTNEGKIRAELTHVDSLW